MPTTKAFPKGSRVKIRTGEFAGLVGTVRKYVPQNPEDDCPEMWRIKLDPSGWRTNSLRGAFLFYRSELEEAS